MCNGYNHPPGCNCGFAGGWKNSGFIYGNKNPGLSPAPEFAHPDGFFPACFLTNCYWCNKLVYFIRNGSNGGCFLADSLGSPWEMHPCWLHKKREQIPAASYAKKHYTTELFAHRMSDFTSNNCSINIIFEGYISSTGIRFIEKGKTLVEVFFTDKNKNTYCFYVKEYVFDFIVQCHIFDLSGTQGLRINLN